MSFTTGRAQRRGNASSNNGYKAAEPPSSGLSRTIAGSVLNGQAKRKRVASIGDDYAVGLTIVGHNDIGTTGTEENPDFPISYTGKGTLKFVSPVRIATVDGPLNVNGLVYSNGVQLGASSGGGGGSSVEDIDVWTPTVGATGTGNNFTTNVASTWATYHEVADNITIHLHYTWSSKGSVADGSAIFIKGLPFALETQVHKTLIHPTNIIATQYGSYFIAHGAVDSSELAITSADSATGLEVVITGGDCGATGTINCIFSYHGVIP